MEWPASWKRMIGLAVGRPRGERAFTLPEVLVGLAILGVAVLSLIAVIGVALRERAIGLRQAQGSEFADGLQAIVESALPEILLTQSEQASSDQHAFFAPTVQLGGFVLPASVIDARSQFYWLHQGYFDTNTETLGALSTLGFAPQIGGETEPYLAIDTENAGFDFRVAVRVAEWRWRESGGVLARFPLAYDYAIFIFDEGLEVDADLSREVATSTVPTDATSASGFIDFYAIQLESAGGTATFRFANGSASDGPIRHKYGSPGSLVLLEQRDFPLELREAVAVGLGLTTADANTQEVDRALQEQGYVRPYFITPFSTERRLRVPDDPAQFRTGAVYNMLVMPADCRAIVTGRVQL